MKKRYNKQTGAKQGGKPRAKGWPPRPTAVPGPQDSPEWSELLLLLKNKQSEDSLLALRLYRRQVKALLALGRAAGEMRAPVSLDLHPDSWRRVAPGGPLPPGSYTDSPHAAELFSGEAVGFLEAELYPDGRIALRGEAAGHKEGEDFWFVQHVFSEQLQACLDS